MTDLIALTPQHTAPHAPHVIYQVVTMALESIGDGRDISDLNMVLGVSGDVAQGEAVVRHIMGYTPLDGIVCFGATYKSVGLPDDSALLVPIDVRFHRQLRPVKVVRLPAIYSGEWQHTSTVFKAAEAVKALLTVKDPTKDIDLIRPGSVIAKEKGALN